MIIETKSNVFGCNADAIVNTVNCVGVMGRGLALEFALRYPKLEEEYVEDCKRRVVRTGKVKLYTIDGQKIINFPTKRHFVYPSEMSWIEEGLADFLGNYKDYGIQSVAFPLLGASNGGLDPQEVIAVMKRELAKADLTVYICRSTESDPLEAAMIRRFNSTNIDLLAESVRLSAPQKESLASAKGNIRHFYELMEYPKIGDTTYRKLFAYFKNEPTGESKPEQISLF